MNNLPSSNQSVVANVLKNNWKAIQNVLPKHLTPERMARIAYTSIMKNPALAQCNPVSLANAVIEASMLGLEIGGPVGLAHLVPFKGQATLIIGYKGFMDLAYRSGIVSNFSAHPVYENDEFDFEYGINPKLRHKPTFGEKGPLKCAYAVCNYNNGGYDFEIVGQSDIDATKRKSPGSKKKDSPWNDTDIEWTMWVKTAIRRLAKRIPQSPDILRAASVDETGSFGLDQGIDHIIELDFPEGDAPQDTNDLIMNGKGSKKNGFKPVTDEDKLKHRLETLEKQDSKIFKALIKEFKGQPNDIEALEKFEIRFLEIKQG